jgi:hypothetical protein
VNLTEITVVEKQGLSVLEQQCFHPFSKNDVQYIARSVFCHGFMLRWPHCTCKSSNILHLNQPCKRYEASHPSDMIQKIADA